MPVIPSVPPEACEFRPPDVGDASASPDHRPVNGVPADLPRPKVVVWFLVALIVIHTVALGALLPYVFVWWGAVVRTVYVWHVTWLINSAARRWGYRNYGTADRSRNNVVVPRLTNGEGWHNNHHVTPRTCSQGHRWWAIELTFTAVRMMQLVGLARDVIPVQEPKNVLLTR